MHQLLSEIHKYIYVIRIFSIIVFLSSAVSISQAKEFNWRKHIEEGDRDISRQELSQAENSYRLALEEVHVQTHNRDGIVICLEKLASVLVLENKIDEALPLYNKSLHMLEFNYGKDSPKLVPTLFAIGSIFESEGDVKIAMEYYNKALAINEKHYGPLSPGVAESLHHLGHANFSSGKPEKAEEQYKSSLSILMQQSSLASSKQLENLLQDYGDMLKKNDNSDKSLVSDFQTEVLKDRRGFPVPTTGVPPSAWQKQMAFASEKSSAYQNNEEQQILLRGFKQPFNDSTLAPAFKTMADDLYGQHSYAHGEEYYERMIAIDIKALGPYHPSVADDLTGLALFYISQQKYSEAAPLLRRALSVYESVYGGNNLLVTRTRSQLADVLNKLGQTQQAMALYEQVFSKGGIVTEPNNLQTARMLNELAFLYYSQGRLEDARTIYQWALASTKGAVGEQNILVAACLKDYANVLRGLGLSAEANQMSEKICEIEFAQPMVNGVQKSNYDQ